MKRGQIWWNCWMLWDHFQLQAFRILEIDHYHKMVWAYRCTPDGKLYRNFFTKKLDAPYHVPDYKLYSTAEEAVKQFAIEQGASKFLEASARSGILVFDDLDQKIIANCFKSAYIGERIRKQLQSIQQTSLF